jgi:BirA family biotin operon repressor/biotin-[acetyl-CoA-carboxylase] ligase
MSTSAMPDASPPMGGTRVWYPHVTTTMDVAMALAAAGAPHGTLVEAAAQAAGRGRLGRRWEAPAGSAFLGSWLLRVPAGIALTGLSPTVAAAVLRAVDDIAPGAPAQYKWPNDVLIDGRKVAGILLTSRAAPAGTIVIAGTGVNVHPESVPPGIAATCLAAWAGVTVAAARERLADALEETWRAFVGSSGLPEGERRWLEARMSWRGEEVEVLLPEGTISGVVTGVAVDGGLRLRPPGGGAERVLHVGEIARGPRPAARAGAESTVYLPEHDCC